MKKLISKIILVAITLYSLPAKAGLGDLFPDDIPHKNILEILAVIINAIIYLSGSIAVWFLIVGGAQYITSAGNPDQVNKAKNTIFYAIIGLIVVILSYTVVNFVITNLS